MNAVKYVCPSSVAVKRHHGQGNSYRGSVHDHHVCSIAAGRRDDEEAAESSHLVCKLQQTEKQVQRKRYSGPGCGWHGLLKSLCVNLRPPGAHLFQQGQPPNPS